MDSLKIIIASNIQALRKSYPLTQAELAEKLNYSDKAVSKWERGESVPDIEILVKISELFGVSVDYLVKDHGDEAPKVIVNEKKISLRNRILIPILSIILVWAIATIAVIVLDYVSPSFKYNWLIMLSAAVISLIIALVFNSIWGIGKVNYVIISLMLWMILWLIYRLLLKEFPVFFAIGIPGQVLIILSSFLSYRNKK